MASLSCEADHTVFFRYGSNGSIEIAGWYVNNGSIEIAGWYVNNGLLAADSPESMDHMITDIRGSFDIQDLGEPERLLGVKITRNRIKGQIHISQPAYIDSIAKRFNITPGKSITTPMETYIDL